MSLCLRFLSFGFLFLFQPQWFQDQVSRAPTGEGTLQDHHPHESQQCDANCEATPPGYGCEAKDQNASNYIPSIFKVHI
jgi:hypothetical protein